ncbi:TPA: hypothetical protein EYP66_18235 [Candidatus Poribacteria bacterium]|nr:hypothetical protein [Candidatus Poribacteria bacterium]
MDKKIGSAIIAFAVFILLLMKIDAYAVENVIQNGDFEDGQIGWAVAARGAAAMDFVIDDTQSVVGKKSARFEIKNVGGGGVHDLTLDCQTPISIKNGKTYTVDFWLKSEKDRTITIDFLMNHDPWTRAFQVENIPITAEWQVKFHTFKAVFGDNNMIFLFSFSKASNQNPKVTTWIDHVRFYQGEYEEENLSEKSKAVTPDGKLPLTYG